METRGTALLTDEIPAQRALTTTISREEIAGALQHPDRSPELYLDLDYGEEQNTVGISWSYDELESLFERTSGDHVTLTFDRDELQSLFDDVEAHGLREKALIFTVAVAGAFGSAATIANAAPTLADNPGGSAASVAQVEDLAAKSIVAEGGYISNAHTPGLQSVDSASTASASVSSAKADEGFISNAHTPGLMSVDEGTTASTPAVQVSTGSSDGEFLGVDTRDATEALIAGGVLLAIAGATFAGTRRQGTARPA